MYKTSAAVAAFLVIAWAAPARAESPATIPIQGTLSDREGIPISGTLPVVVTIYDAAVDGAVLYQEVGDLAIDRGSFTYYLGANEALDLALFRDVGSTYLGLKVADDPEMTPRIRLGSVPYAAYSNWAGDAETLEGEGKDSFAPATHGHAWGDITNVPPDLADGDDDTTYDGTDFATSNQICAGGMLVVGIDANGELRCTFDGDSTYDGTDFALSNQACAPGSVVTGVTSTGVVACAADVDTDTTYDGSDFATSNQSCAIGSVVTGIDGSGAVTCAPDKDTDTDTTYDGSDFAVSGQTCPAGQRVVGISASGAIQCQAVRTVPAGMIAFFAGPCPGGFTEYTALRGRFLVGTPSGGTDEGSVGAGLANLGHRAITQVPAHAHLVNPPNTGTSSVGGHTHSVNPAPVATSTAGNHGHPFYTAHHDTNSSSSQGYPANNNHLAFRTTDRRQRTQDNGDIQARGAHTHTVDIPPTGTTAAGAHNHSVDIPAFSSGATGVASVDVTMPYIQLRACVAL